MRVIVLLLYLRWALPRRKLPDIVERLRNRSGRCSRRADRRLVALASALLRRRAINPRGDCLPLALVAFHLASRRGLDARVHCGVKRGEDSVIAHAWATADGVELYGTSSAGHLELLALP